MIPEEHKALGARIEALEAQHVVMAGFTSVLLQTELHHFPERLDYTATKAAINNFSKGLALQVASHGIRVNVVAPGPVWIALQVSGGVSDEQMKTFGDESTYKRSGQPGEIAPAFVFLASDESS